MPNALRTCNYYTTQPKGEQIMARRKAMKGKKDRKIYTTTANSTKKINVAPKISRGGIRL